MVAVSEIATTYKSSSSCITKGIRNNFKDVEGINDETALHELSLLVEEEAATWCAEVKEDVYI